MSPPDKTTIIHVVWEGPLTLDEAQARNHENDYGLYQIHGCLMLSTEAPVGEGIESSESGGVSVLTEGAGSVAA